MDYITKYRHLCKPCASKVASIAGMMDSDILGDSQYTADPEGPLMYASDHNLLCGGAHCRATAEGDRPNTGTKVFTCHGQATVKAWHGDMGRYEVVLSNGHYFYARPTNISL